MPEKNIVIRGQRKNLNLFDDFISEQQIDEFISLYPFPYNEEVVRLGFEEFGDIEQSVRSPASQAGNSGS